MSGSARVNNDNSDREIEEFLKRWMPLPHDPEGCPPFSVLESAAKDPSDTAQRTQGSQVGGVKQRDWSEHIETCDYCKKMVDLLKPTARPKITLEHIFAKASREAQEARARERDLAEANMPSILRGFSRSAVFGTRPRSAIAFAASIILVAAVWLVGKQLNFFKTSDDVATVFFEKNYSKDLLQTLDEKLAKLERSDIKEQEESNYVNDYNDTTKVIASLNKQKKIPKEDRAEIALMMARYRSELERQIKDNRNNTTNPTRPASDIQNEPDTAVVLSLFSNVDHAVAKKNETVISPTEEIPNSSVVKSWSQQLKVEFDNADANVSVQDKLPNRSKEQSDALVRGVQTFATQNGRTVNLRIGGGSLTITPTTSFASMNPKE